MPTDVGRTSDLVANALLDYLWGAVAPTIMPATTYWGLSTTEPANDGTGITEPTDSGYALLAVARNTTNFPAASDRSIANGVTIQYGAASSGGSGFGLIGWLPVWNNSSRTVYLGHWVVTGGPQTIGAGIAPSFAPGALTWVDAGT